MRRHFIEIKALTDSETSLAHDGKFGNANEMIVLPTRAMGPDDADYAVAFAVPLDTPGLTLVASPSDPKSTPHRGSAPT